MNRRHLLTLIASLPLLALPKKAEAVKPQKGVRIPRPRVPKIGEYGTQTMKASDRIWICGTVIHPGPAEMQPAELFDLDPIKNMSPEKTSGKLILDMTDPLSDNIVRRPEGYFTTLDKLTLEDWYIEASYLPGEPNLLLIIGEPKEGRYTQKSLVFDDFWKEKRSDPQIDSLLEDTPECVSKHSERRRIYESYVKEFKRHIFIGWEYGMLYDPIYERHHTKMTTKSAYTREQWDALEEECGATILELRKSYHWVYSRKSTS